MAPTPPPIRIPGAPDRLLADDLLALVLKARAAVLEVYRQADHEVELKSDRTPLTLADRRAHQILSAGLNRLTPALPILSEEGSDLPWTIRKDRPLMWLVDPLDGTREFVERTDEFTINVALIKDHEPWLGIMDVPVQATTYVGIRNGGAFRVDGHGGWTPIHAAGKPDPDRGVRFAVSRSHASDERRWIEASGLRVAEIRPAGSALKFSLIAEGAVDCYPRVGPTMEWDTGAGQCLVAAAGGEVTQFDGSPLRYNRENLKNPGFIARGFRSEASGL